MDIDTEEKLEDSFLPAYTLVRSIIYSDYERKKNRYSKTQIAVLAALYWQNEMCMSQMAELIATPRPQMTRAIIPLVDDGLIERFEDKANRKLVYIRLTGNGRQFVKSYLRTRFDALREELSEEEAESLTEAARTIVRILKKKRDK